MTTIQETNPAASQVAQDDDILLEVNNLKMYFPVTSGMLFQRTVAYVKAVDDLTFSVKRGETLGLVGGERLRQNHHGPLHTATLQAHRRRGRL